MVERNAVSLHERQMIGVKKTGGDNQEVQKKLYTKAGGSRR